MTIGGCQEESDIATWEERIRRMTQMSEGMDAGLYDDVLEYPDFPTAKPTTTLSVKWCGWTPTCPTGSSSRAKRASGNDVLIVTHRVVLPTEAAADPERYETRTRPEPVAKPRTPTHATLMDNEQVTKEQYWEERIRRMTQMSQDVGDGLYYDVPIPMAEAPSSSSV